MDKDKIKTVEQRQALGLASDGLRGCGKWRAAITSLEKTYGFIMYVSCSAYNFLQNIHGFFMAPTVAFI
jgi:hypothetical protein